MPNKSEIARQLAKMRPVIQGTCVVCGAPIEGVSTKRYCSNRCAVRAFRQRQKAKAREGQPVT